jgi:hypothetical protein
MGVMGRAAQRAAKKGKKKGKAGGAKAAGKPMAGLPAGGFVLSQLGDLGGLGQLPNG